MKIQTAFFSCIILAACQNQNTTDTSMQKDSASVETVGTIDNTVSETEPEQIVDSIFNTDNYLVDHKSIKNNFSFITENCGIFIRLDSMQMEKMIKEYGEDDFTTMTDDDAFYDYNASEFLNKMQIKSIYPLSRYLKFKVNGDTVCMDTKSRFNTMGMTILYKKNTLPKIYGTSDIEEAYRSYFE